MASDAMSHTKVTYVVKTDIKGAIPGWVKARKAREQPMQLATIRKMLDEEAAEAVVASGGFHSYSIGDI